VKNKILLLVLFISYVTFSQSTPIQLFKGVVKGDSLNLEGIHVINHSQKKGTTTLQEGYFSLEATVSDTIIFSAVGLKPVQYIVNNTDFGTNLLSIKMETTETTLNEVFLTEYKNINAVALGIVPANQKTYTQAERKLHAGSGIFDIISGRTKMLKKELQIERKEILLESLKSDFSDSYLIDKLSIPKDYINGFLYYIVERENFIRIYKTNNKSAIEFLLIELSVEYLKLLNLNVTKDVKKKN
jgi:hypothetical protein